ncbi:MAG: aldehyde ferredoxin oxidoreductase family protein [Thermodesulfobacteriota bacterium]
MPFGYNGKILRVDLSLQRWWVEEPDEKWYRTYMGGSAFGAYYLLKLLKPGVDPLSPGNVAVFACSVVTGAPISGWNRYTVAAKSPLTHAFGESEAGGYFGPELKFAGFDAIVIEGRAAKPTYLFIKDGVAQFRDAKDVWGLDNYKTLRRIQEEVGDKRVRVASIGPAGERLIRFANVGNDVEHFNGRTGMGAVLGSKNLKAVAVRGTRRMESAEKDRVREIARWHNARIKTHPPNVGLSRFGTPGLLKGLNASGILPTRNFREGVFEGADRLNADAYASILYSSGTCWSCAVKCKRRVALEDEKYPLNPKWGGPEYETLAAFGSLIGNGNLPAVARANQLCNLYGMDTITMGNLTAFVMECFEKGILTEKDTGGRKLEFGDPDALLWLIEEVVHRRGIGDILAEGVKAASERIGRGSEQFAFTIKGNDLPMHEGRGKTGMALGYALSSTGADHVETPHDGAFQGDGVSKLHALGLLDPVDPLETDSAKVRFFALGQKAWGINNLLSICNFASVPIHGMTFHNLVEGVRAVTGWDTSLYEILLAVERSMVMSRVFNLREGLGPEDDRVIRRWHEEMPGGPLEGKRLDEQQFRAAIELYYEMSGWDERGRPTFGKLVELNLEWLRSEIPR